MAIEVHELTEGFRVSTSYGESPWAERKYAVTGSDDKDAVREAVAAEAETLFDIFGNGLFFISRSSIVSDRIDDEVWDVVVRWDAIRPTGESEYNFDTRGGTQHITHALLHIQDYAPSGEIAPNHHGLIGVTKQGVEGVDIVLPVFHLIERHYLDASLVTDNYIDLLWSLTGTVNNALFKRRASGERLFLGASGSRRGCGDWVVDFEFADSPNRTGLVIGDITGINKKGWEHMWVETEDAVDATSGRIVRTVLAVHIEQVYYYGDFSLLGIGT